MRKQILALSLGVASLSAVAQKAELKAAEKAIKKQEFNSAITSLNAAEKLIANADNKYKSKFYFLKGKAYAAKKDYKTSAEAINKLIAFEKQIGKSKYTGEAQPMLNKMIQDVSNKAINLYNNKKDYKNASEYFYLTYVLSPKDTSFVYNAAIASHQAKDLDTALKYYTELKDINYTGIETQYLATNKLTGKVENLGSKQQRDLMIKTKQYIKPENKVSESKYSTIVKNIAFILKEQGKTDEAIKALAEARKANPKDLNLLLNEADMYIKLKQMDKFGKLMSEAIALDPNNPTLYYNLGVVNFNQGRVEDAKKYYKKAVELKPDYGDAYMNLAVVVLDQDKAIVEEMNKNLSNFKKYDELALKQKEVYKEAIPYLEKADGLNRTMDTVKTLMNIYEVLEMEGKAKEYRDIYKSMK
ncbi:tetratricopeptide repeat protein [Tenacibaculum sp. 190524A02b]|uniref:tetratricopeptide repeat protein n=1 Tax=Tenacibaculum vairaonense TaxID=3137860 RepID=UPI0031FA5D78